MRDDIPVHLNKQFKEMRVRSVDQVWETARSGCPYTSNKLRSRTLGRPYRSKTRAARSSAKELSSGELRAGTEPPSARLLVLSNLFWAASSSLWRGRRAAPKWYNLRVRRKAATHLHTTRAAPRDRGTMGGTRRVEQGNPPPYDAQTLREHGPCDDCEERMAVCGLPMWTFCTVPANIAVMASNAQPHSQY